MVFIIIFAQQRCINIAVDIFIPDDTGQIIGRLKYGRWSPETNVPVIEFCYYRKVNLFDDCFQLVNKKSFLEKLT